MSAATSTASTAVPRLPVSRSFTRPPEPDPLLEIARLRRDLTSHQLRLASYAAALNRQHTGAPVETTHVTFVAAPALIGLALQLEAQGRAPVVRFQRDHRGRITGVELAMLAPGHADAPALAPLPDDMAVIVGDEVGRG